MSETKQLTVIEDVRNNLTRMKSQFAAALPPHIKPERFLRVVMTAVTTTPKLLDGDRTSLFAACTKAAQDGLLPDGKESALVPFGSQITFMPMYAGILKKFRNSGECKTIMAAVVYEKDKFRYWVDSEGEHIEHEPLIFGERGDKKGFYAQATTKDGGVYIEVMTLKDMAKVKGVSKTSSRGPWKDWPEEMEKKSVIRRLSKRLPMSTDLEGFIQQNDELINFDKETATPPETTPTRAKALINDAIDTTATTTPPPSTASGLPNHAPPPPMQENEVPI